MKNMIERLLDSVILIDHFNGIPEATRFISGLDPDRGGKRETEGVS